MIGAGFMGASIAYVSARAGIDVVLIDRDQESADKGKGHAQAVIDDLIKKGRAKESDRDALLARITPTADYAALGDCDLVIEAVFEDRKVKADTFAKAQPLSEARRDLRLQHLDAADHLAGRGVQGPGQIHRHPLLLAGREDDAGRDHPRQEHRRPRACDRAGLCARDQEDADRRQRHARLLCEPLRAALHLRRHRDVPRRRAAGDDRELRQDGRHAGRSAGTVRRSGDRPRR